MRHNDFLNLKFIAETSAIVTHYCDLVSYFPQLEKDNQEIKAMFTLPYHKSQLVLDWENVNIHITRQTWGSTACGWGGIGGAAITTSTNYIIEQVHSGLCFVYWSGKLAYVAKKENLKDFSGLPSMSSVKAIYKNSRAR